MLGMRGVGGVDRCGMSTPSLGALLSQNLKGLTFVKFSEPHS